MTEIEESNVIRDYMIVWFMRSHLGWLIRYTAVVQLHLHFKKELCCSWSQDAINFVQNDIAIANRIPT